MNDAELVADLRGSVSLRMMEIRLWLPSILSHVPRLHNGIVDPFSPSQSVSILFGRL